MRKLVYKGAEDLCLRSLMCDKASANAGTRSHKWVWPLDCTSESVRVSRRGSLRDTLTSGKKIAQRVESSKLQGRAVDCCKVYRVPGPLISEDALDGAKRRFSSGYAVRPVTSARATGRIIELFVHYTAPMSRGNLVTLLREESSSFYSLVKVQDCEVMSVGQLSPSSQDDLTLMGVVVPRRRGRHTILQAGSRGRDLGFEQTSRIKRYHSKPRAGSESLFLKAFFLEKYIFLSLVNFK